MQVIFAQAHAPPAVPKRRTRLPSYQRAAQPPPFQLTHRDGAILQTLYCFDGVMADYQIMKLFFDSSTRMKARMSILFQNGFVARLNRQQRAQLPFMVYWLDKKGIAYIAQQEGIETKELHWRRPGERWSLVVHDVELNDFRIAIESARQQLKLPPVEWVGESEFRAHPDRVTFKNGQGKQVARDVRPDGYFVLTISKGKKRFLVEWDRRTMPNPRFLADKVFSGLTYLGTNLYRERFGSNTGSWLVITTGNRRAAHMKEQVERAKLHNGHYWYFTTREHVTSANLLTDPIWLRPGHTHPVSLLAGLKK